MKSPDDVKHQKTVGDVDCQKMIRDLTEMVSIMSAVLVEAKAFQFHDFKSTKFPFPKTILKTKLEWIIEKIIAGEYDNMSYEKNDPKSNSESQQSV